MSCVSINVLAISSCMYTCIANRYFNPSRDRSSPNPRKQLFLKKINGRKFCFFCKFLNVCFIYQKPLLSPVLGPVFIYKYIYIFIIFILYIFILLYLYYNLHSKIVDLDFFSVYLDFLLEITL